MMSVLKRCCFSITVILTICNENIDAECSNNVIISGNNIYILSDKATFYHDAEKLCEAYGGQIAQISDQNERSFFKQYLKLQYLPDTLTVVDIWTKMIVFPVGDDLGKVESYKYRSQSESNDAEDLSQYKIPDKGNLRSIMLYTRSTEKFNHNVTFCYYVERDMIRLDCDLGWMFNFNLYGGSLESQQTIKVHNYVCDSATSKLLITSQDECNFSTNVPFIYLPDISVFIGARSDVNQSDWLWNNGTMITDPTYPPSNLSVCQQMTWPLTYDDGINLRSKECISGLSHHVCRVRVEASLEEVECNGKSLRLIGIPSYIATNASIEVESPNQTYHTSMQTDSGIIISNLTQRTSYVFRVQTRLFECPDIFVTTNASGRTGYGVPDPVMSANASYITSNRCLITWTYLIPHEQIIKFKIISSCNQTNFSTTTTVESKSETSNNLETFQQILNLIEFGYNSEVSFMIQVVSSCGNESEPFKVIETCKTPSAPSDPSASSTLYIAVGVSIGIFLLVIVVVGYIMYRRRKQSRPAGRKQSRTASTEAETTLYAEYMEPYNVHQPPQQCYENVGDDYENVKKNHTYEVVKPLTIYET